jgi:Flp pilus assembly protein TadB
MFSQMIDQFFNWCVLVLVAIGNITGMGYNLANIVIFAIIQPALILLFFVLWRREKRKNKK